MSQQLYVPIPSPPGLIEVHLSSRFKHWDNLPPHIRQLVCLHSDNKIGIDSYALNALFINYNSNNFNLKEENWVKATTVDPAIVDRLNEQLYAIFNHDGFFTSSNELESIQKFMKLLIRAYHKVLDDYNFHLGLLEYESVRDIQANLPDEDKMYKWCVEYVEQRTMMESLLGKYVDYGFVPYCGEEIIEKAKEVKEVFMKHIGKIGLSFFRWRWCASGLEGDPYFQKVVDWTFDVVRPHILALIATRTPQQPQYQPPPPQPPLPLHLPLLQPPELAQPPQLPQAQFQTHLQTQLPTQLQTELQTQLQTDLDFHLQGPPLHQNYYY